MLGFVVGAIVLVAARPRLVTLTAGSAIAWLGEALRIWAAGHLNKSREVTSSGPYRWLAHPLYAGSAIMGVGLAVASGSWLAALLIALYLTTTLTAAVMSEESFLKRTFGNDYERYRGGPGERPGAVAGVPPRFSLGRARANREHRAVIGLAVAMLLLLLKATYNGMFWRAGG